MFFYNVKIRLLLVIYFNIFYYGYNHKFMRLSHIYKINRGIEMSKLKIYIDTSVIGGCFDEEFAKWSNQLFEEFKTGGKLAVIVVIIDDSIIQLAENYLKQKIISEKCREDALHIATATILKIDVLVSWNFKHIVNINRIKRFNGVNLLNGYNTIEIRSPMEVINNDEI